MAAHPVASVSHPSMRMALTIVRFSRRLMGRDSISSVPRRSHACDRPIARFAPDSSRNTSRRGSTVSAKAWKPARSSWTRDDRVPRRHKTPIHNLVCFISPRYRRPSIG